MELGIEVYFTIVTYNRRERIMCFGNYPGRQKTTLLDNSSPFVDEVGRYLRNLAFQWALGSAWLLFWDCIRSCKVIPGFFH